MHGRALRDGSPRRWRNLLTGDVHPLGGMANLFDAGMVFAVALLVALVAYHRVPELLGGDGEITIVKNPGTPRMEILHRKGVRLEHYRMTDDVLRGEGERLGTAYRLASGEVVYVPEGPPGADGR